MTFASAYLIDTPETCALRAGWDTLADHHLAALLELVELSRDMGGSYHDGEEFEPLAEAIETELADRESDDRGYQYDSPSLELPSYAS